MGDLKPLPELSDARLREMASSDRKITQDAETAECVRTGNVAGLEAKIATAKSRHNERFAPGVCSPEQRASQEAIDGLETNLRWARQRRDLIDAGEAARRLKAAEAEGRAATRLFEITSPDGRKLRQSAASADELRRQLDRGYEITAEIFAGGYVKPLDGPSLWDGTQLMGRRFCFGFRKMAFRLSGVVRHENGGHNRLRPPCHGCHAEPRPTRPRQDCLAKMVGLHFPLALASKGARFRMVEDTATRPMGDVAWRAAKVNGGVTRDVFDQTQSASA